MSTAIVSVAGFKLPALTAALVGQMFIAGAVATTAFDFWGQVVSPGIGWANLSPHGLARSLLGSFGLPNNDFAGYFVHFYLIGLIGYPAGWLYLFKPVWDRVTGDKGDWFLPSAVFGFGLWVFAIGGITVVAGLPFFLNFSGIAWVALFGHVFYGIVMAAMLAFVARR